MPFLPISGKGIPIAASDPCYLGEVGRLAKTWCDLLKETRPKPAAVFDVDSTLLYYNEEKQTVTIEAMRDLYNQLREAGIAVFVITARSEEGRSFTVDQLRSIGIHGCEHLYMHPTACLNHAEAARQKRENRLKIERKGYTILLNCGDQWSDHMVEDRNDLFCESSRRGGDKEEKVLTFICEGAFHVKLYPHKRPRDGGSK